MYRIYCLRFLQGKTSIMIHGSGNLISKLFMFRHNGPFISVVINIVVPGHMGKLKKYKDSVKCLLSVVVLIPILGFC